ncbi:hypothetical protein T8K17_09735 [Thalassobaculum sp. OXR-137]|uniref:hypothetical protein n=1 Tax=Thalassobaculum sp. OXR-137 TaxID=3100173 RepID=UPI002AC9B5EB|nr:hypothetical protein [Thalassobaculum sp. OXR-137]WPZ36416.1 hypothetical protein T8K17_09735 [Thalassobaculum sp. OXR-137]
MIRSFPALALIAALAGCALPQSTAKPPAIPVPQLTIVEAVPPDARCRAVGRIGRRDMQAAPMSIEPRKLGFPVEVTCEAPGYLTTTETLYPRPLPDVLSTAKDRLPISPMADLAPAAGAPATSQVPYRLIVPLRGALFATAADRTAFYDALIGDRLARWTALQHQAEAECSNPAVSRAGSSSTSPPELCRRAYNWLRELRDVDLRKLEIDRRRATFR